MGAKMGQEMQEGKHGVAWMKRSGMRGPIEGFRLGRRTLSGRALNERCR
jgi:hypothetical protein